MYSQLSNNMLDQTRYLQNWQEQQNFLEIVSIPAP